MSRKIKILFTISVLLNVLFFGLAAGQGYRAVSKHSWKEFHATLAPETQTLMKQTFREKRKEFKPIMRKMRGEIAKIGEVLVAEEFDTQAFDAATGDLKQINQAMFEQKLETMKALASQLPQEERQKLKGKFARVLMQKHPHKKRDHASQSKREGRGEERAYKKERAE